MRPQCCPQRAGVSFTSTNGWECGSSVLTALQAIRRNVISDQVADTNRWACISRGAEQFIGRLLVNASPRFTVATWVAISGDSSMTAVAQGFKLPGTCLEDRALLEGARHDVDHPRLDVLVERPDGRPVDATRLHCHACDRLGTALEGLTSHDSSNCTRWRWTNRLPHTCAC